MPLNENGKIDSRDETVLEGDFEKKFRLESFEIITTFSYKGRVLKSSYITIVMVFVSEDAKHFSVV